MNGGDAGWQTTAAQMRLAAALSVSELPPAIPDVILYSVQMIVCGL